VLTEVERIRNYEWQNNNFVLTPRQQRRVNHKRGHQSQEAADRRHIRALADKARKP
jgi:hypothetical protein